MKRKWIVIVAALSVLVLVGLMLFRHRAQEEHSQTQQTGSTQPVTARPAPPQKPVTLVSTLGSLPSPPTTAMMEQSTPGEPATEKRFVIRVVDGLTKAPISKAKVHVELEYGLKAKWEGSADSQGIFAFTWRVVRESVKVRIWITAPGFLSVDSYGPLLEDKIFLMNKSS